MSAAKLTSAQLARLERRRARSCVKLKRVYYRHSTTGELVRVRLEYKRPNVLVHVLDDNETFKRDEFLIDKSATVYVLGRRAEK